jgi:hypothetical protein
MANLILNGSTSGSVTLSSPAVSGTTTLTLPATTGNVVTDTATQTLTNKTLTSPSIATPTVTGTLTAADIAYSTTLKNSTSGMQVFDKITSVSSGVSTTVFTLSQSSYNCFIGGTIQVFVTIAGYPEYFVSYLYNLSAYTVYASASWYNNPNQNLVATSFAGNGGSNTIAWSYTKTVNNTNGLLKINITPSGAATVYVRFNGLAAGGTLS